MNRCRTLLVMALTLTVTMAVPVTTSASHDLNPADRATLQQWGAATWHSFVKLVNPRTGLPSDWIGGDLKPQSRAAYTSPTNIAMYMWAVLAARDLGFISAVEARDRLTKTLTTVEGLERHTDSGQFYNWYDPNSGAKLTTWPEPPHNAVEPFASSVDNGWLAAGLLMVANAVPELSARARTLAQSMDFGFYYDPNGNRDAGTGLIRGGFWVGPPSPCSTPGNYRGRGAIVYYTCHHYGAFNTEPRIASYLGIAMGQIPADHYFGGWRTFQDNCDWKWQEMRPDGAWRDYVVNGKTVHVFEGAYRYADKKFVPTWGGSMFEAFMVPLVVPEEQWGPRSWAVTHPLYAEASIEYGLGEAKYGFWGHSPSANPAGGYREYGVDALGMEPLGYTSDQERQALVDYGSDDPGCPRPPDPIESYGSGVVTPHASFLALDFQRDAAMVNLRALQARFPNLYGKGGFKDAVDVASGQIADRYLVLDQGMVIAAIANELLDDQLQRYLAVELEAALRPLMEMEEFNAGRVRP